MRKVVKAELVIERADDFNARINKLLSEGYCMQGETTKHVVGKHWKYMQMLVLYEGVDEIKYG